MLLQKLNNESGQSTKPGNGLKVTFYLLSLGVAYMFGYYQHPKTLPPAPDAMPPSTLTAGPSTSTPSEEASTVPLTAPAATPSLVAALPSATPAIIGDLPKSSPPRVEKALAVTPLSSAPASSAPSAIPIPAAAPEKQANQVTITEPVEIPVKQDGKITGYINLQKGQLITPVSVDHDQIKIKTGSGFVMVPVKSTDMAH